LAGARSATTTSLIPTTPIAAQPAMATAAATTTATATAMAPADPDDSHLEYTAVPGYFAQDDPATDPATFDFTQSFGLIEQPYDTDAELPKPADQYSQWERLAFKIRRLNEEAPRNVRYKLVFAGRHGEGYHNVAQATYGTELWDCYWALQDGNGTASWVDALLTPKGISQAETVARTWRQEMQRGIPLPEVHIVSPMRRCIQTANHTFAQLDLPPERPFKPVIKEVGLPPSPLTHLLFADYHPRQLLRETIGLHTCDMRSPRSAIEAFAPAYTIEPGFSEQDLLYTPTEQESPTARNARLQRFLDEIFDEQSPLGRPPPRTDYYPVTPPQTATYVSLTAHSGAITSLLAVVGHRPFELDTGAAIPLLLRIERKPGPRPQMKVDPPLHAPKCPAGFVPPSPAPPRLN
ncbi:hypothetical protein KEM52_001520, partial [Ascosphaera acerosa]